jgi:hypothetical protein
LFELWPQPIEPQAARRATLTSTRENAFLIVIRDESYIPARTGRVLLGAQGYRWINARGTPRGH